MVLFGVLGGRGVGWTVAGVGWGYWFVNSGGGGCEGLCVACGGAGNVKRRKKRRSKKRRHEEQPLAVVPIGEVSESSSDSGESTEGTPMDIVGAGELGALPLERSVGLLGAGELSEDIGRVVTHCESPVPKTVIIPVATVMERKARYEAKLGELLLQGGRRFVVAAGAGRGSAGGLASRS